MIIKIIKIILIYLYWIIYIIAITFSLIIEEYYLMFTLIISSVLPFKNIIIKRKVFKYLLIFLDLIILYKFYGIYPKLLYIIGIIWWVI
jgi:hypothetical protein